MHWQLSRSWRWIFSAGAPPSQEGTPTVRDTPYSTAYAVAHLPRRTESSVRFSSKAHHRAHHRKPCNPPLGPAAHAPTPPQAIKSEHNALWQVFIDFPDPWPKERHAKRHLLRVSVQCLGLRWSLLIAPR